MEGNINKNKKLEDKFETVVYKYFFIENTCEIDTF